MVISRPGRFVDVFVHVDAARGSSYKFPVAST